MAASTLAQFAISTLSPFIIHDLGLTRARFGFLTATLFFVGGLSSPFMGHIVDRFGGRRTIILLFAFAALGWLAMAMSMSFVWLVGAVAVAGVAGGCGNPVTNHLVMRHVPRNEHGVVMGIKQSGPQFAAIVTGLLLPVGAVVIGWRWVLVLLTAIVAVAAYRGLAVIPRAEPKASAERTAQQQGNERALVSWMTGYALFMGIGISSVLSYVPLYAFELGYDERTAGTTVLCIGLVGLPALIWGGRVSARWATVSMPLSLLAAGSVFFVLIMESAAQGLPWLVWVASIGFALTAVPWHVVGMVAIIRRVHVARAGRASGIVLLGFNAGLVASPIVFGWTVDVTGEYVLGWLGTSAAFAAATAVGLGWHLRSRRVVPT